MQAWLPDLQQLLAHGDAAVLVTVARVEGSAPREAGTKMIVTRDSAKHTIGGGHLEWKAIETARQVLRDGMRSPHMRRLERFALGPSLGQCCGGAVILAFERLDIGDLGWITSLAKRVAAGQSTVRSVSFGPAPDAVMLSDPEPGVDAADCLLWDAPVSTTAARCSPRPLRQATSQSCCSARGTWAPLWFACSPRYLARYAGSTNAMRSFRPLNRCTRTT